MDERERALQAELVLQRLAQVGRIEELLGEVADIARVEVAQPLPLIGAGPGRWSRVTGALARLEAAAALCQRLDPGSAPTAALAETKAMSSIRRAQGTPPGLVVGEAGSMLPKIMFAAESDESLVFPVRSRDNA